MLWRRVKQNAILSYFLLAVTIATSHASHPDVPTVTAHNGRESYFDVMQGAVNKFNQGRQLQADKSLQVRSCVVSFRAVRLGSN